MPSFHVSLCCLLLPLPLAGDFLALTAVVGFFRMEKTKKKECRRCGHCSLLVFRSLFDSARCCCCCFGCCLRDTCPPEFCQDRAKAAYWYLVVVTKTAVQPFPGGYRPQTDRQTLRHSLKLPGEWPPFFWDPCVQRPEIISNDKSDLNAFTDGSSFGKNYLKILRRSFGAHSQLQKKSNYRSLTPSVLFPCRECGAKSV